VDVMSATGRPNTRVAGAGDVSGGTYGEVTIAGAGAVHGDLDATSLKIAGTADVQGKVVATSVKVSGSATFNADVQASEFSVNGTTEVRGGVGAGVLKVAGACTISGSVNAQRIEIRGTTKIGGDVQSEVFDVAGVFSVGGLLNAGAVTIKVYGGCDAHDIGGESIDVRLGKPWAFLPFFGDRNLTADTIEGDTIYLENTRAKVVRGANVEIGPDCAIDLVEYSGTLTGHAGVVASRKVAAQGSPGPSH
jgi:cytoskeletal protein CcmA (bactofilin family)